MDNKNIIIILIVIIVILAAAVGVALFNQTAKEPAKIKITSDKEQTEDNGEISVKLTDLNNTAISKEIVNITITDSKGKVVVDDVVKTDSNGKAKLDLDLKKGKYNVTVSYGGNDNFTGNSSTQKLTIKEEVKQAQSTSASSSNSDPGAFYSHQSHRTFYTGDTKEGADGHTWRHLGNNEWVKID